ncbi:RNAse III [Methanospirillum hungatei JF-1]|jgi:ribonuclease-3|uniref:RNAse III n=1 Tax=Methanospirillum hungatei JF-1 (strain ATCC 27890 / DSM 864 / NBRC 100397 / JF-1) TaxID=323259 RepID=Q2FPP4_METHJ|nr:ribonuclease III domain-containing protein [Methanospirillum hungatei]MBP7034811.1 ribonuclease III [Methanospirillum sp.]OQA55579.1 MAG: ribonuclease III [Euryarchaeota archaeon ADurb.Bin294]ABD40865.1 RNAse III [Methanospirillum hungatei JF-1]MBP9008401.1 ribonuclease III [Methanospirillum sp.]HOW05581.1 ribonuclease III domain-containing protein [Methanospirillum hungatei]
MTAELFPEQLERITGYTFRDKSLLLRALTRLAYSKEQGLSEDSHLDALATLGDAVIELIILTRLVKGGEHDKGAVSLKKMDLVNMSVLRDAARSIHLEQYVRWGKGEARMHVWTSGRVLAECMEAFAGALYLDGGIDAAEEVLERLSLLPE